MRRTISIWPEFNQHWDGVTNFLMAGECAAPFNFPLPPLPDLLDIVRKDDEAKANPGAKGERVDTTDINEQFRKLPIDEALRYNFRMAHYNIQKWDAPGKFLHGFKGRVFDPLQQVLRDNGFTWEWFRMYFFFSGPNCATNYHMDKSNVIAWQRYGTKVFSGLTDPGRWEPREKRMQSWTDTVRKPATLTDADVLAYTMKPGDVLWNCLLTPHWVEATDETACSLNFSIRGLRRNGQLCKHEEEWFDHQIKRGEPTTAASSPY